MTASTLQCPSCGAASTIDAPACSYCGARLLTEACPHCLGVHFRGSRYCPLCGVSAAAEQVEQGLAMVCPGCEGRTLQAVTLGGEPFARCSTCAGLWVAPKAFEGICAREELQSVLIGMFPAVGRPKFSPVFRYRKCPTCAKLMGRKNFAGRSGVILDVCRPHGVWLDKDELRWVLDFIRDGGMVKAKEAQVAELEHRRWAADASGGGRVVGTGEADSIWAFELGADLAWIALGLFS